MRTATRFVLAALISCVFLISAAFFRFDRWLHKRNGWRK